MKKFQILKENVVAISDEPLPLEEQHEPLQPPGPQRPYVVLKTINFSQLSE